MLKFIVVLGLIVLIALVLIAYIFRHEIQTFAHRYEMRDDLKNMRHDLKRKEYELEMMNQKKVDTYERTELEREIAETENLIKDMEKN